MTRPRPEVWEAPDDDRFDDEDDGPDDEGEGENGEGDECEDETGSAEGSDGRDDSGRHDSGGPGFGWHDLGMATAEYAIATLAACGFAGLLLVLLRSSEVRGLLSGIIRRALSVG